jgi:hypothetical protein
LPGTPASPPRISIEAYLGADAALASLRGTNNSLRLDTAGIRLLVELNDDYREEFNAYLQQHQGAVSLPVEYYTVRWYFANNGVTARSIPFDSTIIDTHGIKTLSGADRYIAGIIEQALTPAQRLAVAELPPHAAELFRRSGCGSDQCLLDRAHRGHQPQGIDGRRGHIAALNVGNQPVTLPG